MSGDAVAAGETDLELAEQLMYRFGIATLGDLRGRASARQSYHDELADMNGTQMPAYVNGLMERWSSSEALLAVIGDTDPRRNMGLRGDPEGRRLRCRSS